MAFKNSSKKMGDERKKMYAKVDLNETFLFVKRIYKKIKPRVDVFSSCIVKISPKTHALKIYLHQGDEKCP